jgi:hypothetical protein
MARADKNAAAENMASDHAVVKLLELLDSGMLEPEIFSEIVILHDGGCPRILGQGTCACDPDLQLLPPESAKEKT